MKTFAAQKIVAIFTAVSLAFLQAVPAGFALQAKPIAQLDQIANEQRTTTLDEAQATPAQPAAPLLSDSLTPSPALYPTDLLPDDATPLPIKPKLVPPEVIHYVSVLQEAMDKAGAKVSVSPSCTENGKYAIVVKDANIYNNITQPTSGLKEMSFNYPGESGQINLSTASLVLEYYKQGGVMVIDDTYIVALLFKGMVHAGVAETDMEVLTSLAQIRVRNFDVAAMTISFDMQDKATGVWYVWRAYADADMNSHCERGLPTLLQNYVDALQGSMDAAGAGVSVGTHLKEDGKYEIVVSKAYTTPPASGFKEMRYPWNGSSAISYPTGIVLEYYKPGGVMVIDDRYIAALLLKGMFHAKVARNYREALVAITGIRVRNFDVAAMTISFDMQDKATGVWYVWRAYTDADGTSRVERGLPVPVQNYVDRLQVQFGAVLS